MPDFNALASWLQDRYTEDAARYDIGPEPVEPEVCGDTWTDWLIARDAWKDRACEQPHTKTCGYRMGEFGEECSCDIPGRLSGDVASKRALLADLMAEGHEHWCPQCPPALSPDEDCICELGARLLRRLRILASPYAGRDDMPAELREEVP